MTQEEKVRAYDEALKKAQCWLNDPQTIQDCNYTIEDAIQNIFPQLKESEDERIRKRLIEYFEGFRIGNAKVKWEGLTVQDVLDWLEKQKENPKSADSIPSDCVSDVRCEDRWHKVGDSLPDNGRLVLAKDCLGNVLLARYDGENWEVNVYDNEDHYCHNSISKWCEIPSEKQKEQNPTATINGEPIPTENYSVDIPLAEWSEEDEKMLSDLRNTLGCLMNAGAITFKTKKKFSNWLKSLRPSWKPSEDELAKKHLDGYCMGREDTLREMKDFVESHFNCENAKKGTPIVYNTQSGTSTLKAEG